VSSVERSAERICRTSAGRSITAMTFMRGLLMGVRDVGAHFGQGVHGIEHPEIRLMAWVHDVMTCSPSPSGSCFRPTGPLTRRRDQALGDDGETSVGLRFLRGRA
jgi:hypothetical protein